MIFIRRYATIHKVQTYNGFQPTVGCPHTPVRAGCPRSQACRASRETETRGRGRWSWVATACLPRSGNRILPWVSTHGSRRPPIVPVASATAEPHRGCPDSWCIRTMAPAFPCGREIVSFRRYSSVATRRGVGGVALRGLKPTAKFIRRYATMHKVQTYNGFQPTVACPHTHPCGRDACAPRPVAPAVRQKPVDVGVGRGLQPHVCRVAATEFCRGFQPTDHVAHQSSPSRQRRLNPTVDVPIRGVSVRWRPHSHAGGKLCRSGDIHPSLRDGVWGVSRSVG
jgi:hypothetical protein